MEFNSVPRIIFITGTDTGVGKTFLTSLLLSHLRQTRRPAFALKPFCSGPRADAELLHSLQDGELALDEINPFYFREPLAPLVAARKHRRKITRNDALAFIQRSTKLLQTLASRSINPLIHQSTNPSINTPLLHHSSTPFLLIEGAGGLLTPLGEKFNLLDLISSLASAPQNPKSKIQNPKWNIHVIVVARNQLGCINHTLLAIQALRTVQNSPPEFRHHASLVTPGSRISPKLTDYSLLLTTVLMSPCQPDPSTRSNPAILSELLPRLPLVTIPYLPELPRSISKASAKSLIKRSSKRLSKKLEQLLACPASP